MRKGTETYLCGARRHDRGHMLRSGQVIVRTGTVFALGWPRSLPRIKLDDLPAQYRTKVMLHEKPTSIVVLELNVVLHETRALQSGPRGVVSILHDHTLSITASAIGE